MHQGFVNKFVNQVGCHVYMLKGRLDGCTPFTYVYYQWFFFGQFNLGILGDNLPMVFMASSTLGFLGITYPYKVGPLLVTSGVITSISRVITPVTQL